MYQFFFLLPLLCLPPSPPLPSSLPPSHSPDGVEIPAERMREYEALDIKVCVCVCPAFMILLFSPISPSLLPPLLSQVIEVIKRDILSASTQVPHDFLETLTSILNRGSIHSAADQLEGMMSW